MMLDSVSRDRTCVALLKGNLHRLKGNLSFPKFQNKDMYIDVDIDSRIQINNHVVICCSKYQRTL